ncbi:MAG: NUDIX domain-containing protein [Methylocystis sp.]|uniref:NUDIX domain-containing protein n=1 Tax=Methylocystis sp. TaxID=1911079 RepID=UPI003DA27270
MSKHSAGVLLYRWGADRLEVLLVHPGGPFWARKDEGAWSIPKGEVGPGEAAEAAAMREFSEETGFSLSGPLTPLGVFRQPSGKRVEAFALEGDADPDAVKSNLCEIEWPPRSKRAIAVPEVDRAGWFTIPQALTKIIIGQRPILEALTARLASAPPAG